MSKRRHIPQYFGKYLLLERIAVGGMAEIFRAVLRGVAGFEKTVALKRILPVFGDDDGFVTLFQDEARTVSTLTHANIAQVFEFGEVDGSYFLTMELVEGTDLSRLVKAVEADEQAMELTTAAFIVAEAASGLAYAHQKCGADGRALGIVHRDVSPQNILLSYSGGVKVTDFGIAKAKDKVHQTATGMMMGKLRYMSPEQVAGNEIDGRSDVFALGVVLYELITGGPIFPGEQTVRLAELIHTTDIPPPSQRNSAIPTELDRIIGLALARDYKDRYASAAALSKDLTLYRNQTNPGFTPQDLGDFIHQLFPPKQQPAPADVEAMADAQSPHSATKPTPLQRRSSGAASQIITPSGQALTAAEAVDATQIAHSNATVRPSLPGNRSQMDLETRTRADVGSEPIELVSRKASSAGRRTTGRRTGARRKKSVSREAWIAVGLGVIIMASATLVLAKFVLTDSDRAVMVVDAAPTDATRELIDAGTNVANNPLGITPAVDDEAAKGILSRLNGNAVTRRGTATEDYIVFLDAIDYQLASIRVDNQGRAATPRSLPPAVADRVTEHNLAAPIADVMQYLRLTGALPETVAAAARGFMARNDNVSLFARTRGGTRLPPYSVAALAAWLSPESPDLAALAFANSRLDRFCDNAAPPNRRGLPLLCQRDALLAALVAADPQSPHAEALRRERAASHATSVAIGDATFTIERVDYAHEGGNYNLQLAVTVTGPVPNDIQYLLQCGGMRSPGRSDGQVTDGQLTLRFSLPKTMYAPVLQLWSVKQGSAMISLPLPSTQ